MRAVILPHPLSGTIAAIPSKSEAHRHIILAALADSPTRLLMTGGSEDIDATIGCVTALGARVERTTDGLVITPQCGDKNAQLLDCRESGTTLRLLLPVAAAVGSRVALSGCGRLPERPLGELIAAMRAHGCAFSGERLPLEVSGRLHSGVYNIAGDVSSQFVSGLLLALPLLDGDSELELSSPLGSAAYVELTLDAMRRYGVAVEPTPRGYAVAGGQRYRSPGVVRVGGDWSNAALLFAAGAVGGGVTVTGLDVCSIQGDRQIIDLLRRFGAEVTAMDGSLSVRADALHGCEIDIDQTPDLLPPLCVVAACARGTTRFSGGARLRLKESDRLSTCARMLHALGCEVAETGDGLTVRGGILRGGSVEGFGDHRIVMAAAIAASVCTGSTAISGAEAVRKSYPAFFEAFGLLGGIAQLESDE